MVGDGEEGLSKLDLLIRKNGVDSVNKIKVKLDRSIELDQENETEIENEMELKGKTGDNEVKDTTGGSVGVGTGDVEIDVEITNTSGFNSADLDNCDCAEMEVEATIKKNGADSDNVVKAELEVSLEVEQENSCGSHDKPRSLFDMLFGRKHHKDDECFENELELVGNTGDNEVKDTTGEDDSDPVILTGMSKIKAMISNMGGSNFYSPLQGY
jgi:hypothetical protein